METKLKPFDLEAAKAGAPVITRDGRPVRIICYDARRARSIVALVNNGNYEDVELYIETGISSPVRESAADLFMAPVTHRGWAVICHNKFNDSRGCFLYKTEEQAQEQGRKCEDYITTKLFEWEE